MRFNARLATHCIAATAFALGAHPLALASNAQGQTIVVALCSQPGGAATVEIPIDGKRQHRDDGAKPCHAMCCSRRGDDGTAADQDDGDADA